MIPEGLAGPLTVEEFRDLLAFLLSRRRDIVHARCSIVEVQTELETKPEQKGATWWRRALVGRRPRWTLARVVALIVVTFVLFKFFFFPIRLEGNSMWPTYQHRAIKLVNKAAYRKHPPRRGDVVAIRLPGTTVMEVKRIIGLPGERVSVRRRTGAVYINGERLDEPYLKNQVPWFAEPLVLGEQDYFVVGDNRRISEFGPVPLHRIAGKVIF